MKYLPKGTVVWAIPVPLYHGNTQGGWEPLDGLWGELTKVLKIDFEIFPVETKIWKEKSNKSGAGNFFFYEFSEPIDNFVGFLFNGCFLTEK